MKHNVGAAWLVLASLAAACGGTAPIGGVSGSAGAGVSDCAPGQTVACGCSGGGSGLQICTTKRAYGACLCADGSASGGADAGGADAGGADAPSDAGAAGGGGNAGGATDAAADGSTGADADAGLAPTGCVPSGKLIGGKEQLIELFPIDAGIIVVRADALLLVGRDRTIVKTVTAPRPITTAVFDGTSLVVADAAMLTIYTPALVSQGTVLLTEPCAAAALMDGGILVCGPQQDWQRTFYTYDINAKRAIAQSSKQFTYHGVPMRRVPGTSYFITVDVELEPSDFYLYQVPPDGSDVVFVNQSSDVSDDVYATMTFGFDATPATDLISVQGTMLRILGTGCDAQHNSFTSGCFTKDGALGTLPANSDYLAMSNDAAGRLFALTNNGGVTAGIGPLCPGGCNVQLIDVASRTIVSQRKHLMAVNSVIALRPDTACKMVALGYAVATSTDQFDYEGYQIDLVDYGEE